MDICITLKSGRILEMSDFTHINYVNAKGMTVKVENFDNFYLYNRLLTFVGKNQIITISSEDIESIQYYNVKINE